MKKFIKLTSAVTCECIIINVSQIECIFTDQLDNATMIQMINNNGRYAVKESPVSIAKELISIEEKQG